MTYDICGLSQELIQRDISNNNNYFGTRAIPGEPPPSYVTINDIGQQTPYMTQNDIQNQIDMLPPINNNNAPTGVINTYLSYINDFYQRQIASIYKENSKYKNQTLEYDNQILSGNPAIKLNKFFVYDSSVNNTYTCEPSITGNDKFKYCGPSSYYSEFVP